MGISERAQMAKSKGEGAAVATKELKRQRQILEEKEFDWQLSMVCQWRKDCQDMSTWPPWAVEIDSAAKLVQSRWLDKVRKKMWSKLDRVLGGTESFGDRGSGEAGKAVMEKTEWGWKLVHDPWDWRPPTLEQAAAVPADKAASPASVTVGSSSAASCESAAKAIVTRDYEEESEEEQEEEGEQEKEVDEAEEKGEEELEQEEEEVEGEEEDINLSGRDGSLTAEPPSAPLMNRATAARRSVKKKAARKPKQKDAFKPTTPSVGKARQDASKGAKNPKKQSSSSADKAGHQPPPEQQQSAADESLATSTADDSELPSDHGFPSSTSPAPVTSKAPLPAAAAAPSTSGAPSSHAPQSSSSSAAAAAAAQPQPQPQPQPPQPKVGENEPIRGSGSAPSKAQKPHQPPTPPALPEAHQPREGSGTKTDEAHTRPSRLSPIPLPVQNHQMDSRIRSGKSGSYLGEMNNTSQSPWRRDDGGNGSVSQDNPTGEAPPLPPTRMRRPTGSDESDSAKQRPMSLQLERPDRLQPMESPRREPRELTPRSPSGRQLPSGSSSIVPKLQSLPRPGANDASSSGRRNSFRQSNGGGAPSPRFSGGGSSVNNSPERRRVRDIRALDSSSRPKPTQSLHRRQSSTLQERVQIEEAIGVLIGVKKDLLKLRQHQGSRPPEGKGRAAGSSQAFSVAFFAKWTTVMQLRMMGNLAPESPRMLSQGGGTAGDIQTSSSMQSLSARVMSLLSEVDTERCLLVFKEYSRQAQEEKPCSEELMKDVEHWLNHMIDMINGELRELEEALPYTSSRPPRGATPSSQGNLNLRRSSSVGLLPMLHGRASLSHSQGGGDAFGGLAVGSTARLTSDISTNMVAAGSRTPRSPRKSSQQAERMLSPRAQHSRKAIRPGQQRRSTVNGSLWGNQGHCGHP